MLAWPADLATRVSLALGQGILSPVELGVQGLSCE